MATAKNGDTVRVHYKGSLEDGQIFDTSEGRQPLEFQLGAGQVIPGFEQAVAGMEPGESKAVTVPSEAAYGPHRTENVVTVGRDNLPPNIDPEVGQQLQLNQGGQAYRVVITDVSDENVVLDANHPLAGKDLSFELELVEIV